MHIHTQKHTPYLISKLGLHGNTKQVTIFQRGKDWGTYRQSSCLCLLEYVFVCVCDCGCLAVFPVLLVCWL